MSISTFLACLLLSALAQAAPYTTPSELSWAINPNFFIFTGHTSAPNFLSVFNHSDIAKHTTGEHTAKVSKFLGTSCTLEITTYATDEIKIPQLLRLLNATFSDTDLLCYVPEHYILGTEYPDHTMLSSDLRIEVREGKESKYSDAATIEYKIHCPSIPKAPGTENKDGVGEGKDCNFCEMIAQEFEVQGTLPGLGKLANEMNWKVNSATCTGCSNLAM